MKVLILDDEKSRHDFYISKYKKEEVFCCYTLAAFKATIEKVNPDIIHLDYDLYLDQDYKVGDSGLVAARILKKLLDSKQITTKTVIIHSMNDGGRTLIYDKLFGTKNLEIMIKPFGKELF